MIVVSLASQKNDEILDPLATQYINQYHLLDNLTARLVFLDSSGEYRLNIAESIIEVNELELIIKIKNCFFSNGEKITLEDVKSSLERTIKSGSMHVNLKDVIASLQIIDNSLHVYFLKKSKPFFYYLSLPDMGILHKNQYIKAKLTSSDFYDLSSGPYSYDYEEGDYFLVKNKFYSIDSKNYPDKVKLIGSLGYSFYDLISRGELSFGQTSLRKLLEKRNTLPGNIRITGTLSDSLTYIFFNENSSRFKNESHRRWLRTIIDKHFYVPEEYKDIARKTKQYFPPESKASLPEEEVEMILKEGLVEEKPEGFPSSVNIHTYTTGYDVTVEPLIRQLEAITEVKINVLDSIKPNEKNEKLKNGEIDLFIDIISTDARVPVETMNFEFFSKGALLIDKMGSIRERFDNYLSAENDFEETKALQEISRLVLQSDQILPLFHHIVPIVYDSSRIDLSGLNYLSVFKFWKIKV